MTLVELTKAKDDLLKLIERVQHGEDVVITKDDKPIVRIVAVKETTHRHFGSAKGLISFADDFDAPLEDFAEYT